MDTVVDIHPPTSLVVATEGTDILAVIQPVENIEPALVVIPQSQIGLLAVTETPIPTYATESD